MIQRHVDLTTISENQYALTSVTVALALLTLLEECNKSLGVQKTPQVWVFFFDRSFKLNIFYCINTEESEASS